MENQTLKIFVVEDDEWYGKMLEYHLSLNPEYEIEKFTNGKDLLQNLHRRPSIITLDYSLPDFTGEELLEKIKSFDSGIPVVIISGQDDISTAVELLKSGAFDYIVKDESTKDRVWSTLIRVRETLKLQKEISHLKEEVVQKYNFGKFLKGNSKPIRQIFGLMEKAAKSNITTSIYGETGTGKEVAAKSIHYNSKRKKNAFVAVNVAAIPRELIESELFGHEKGAFTGANSRRIGKFEEADGGTLFLDEIGEMDLNMQSKLLRVLQEREVVRVGGNAAKKIDVRVIVATHRNLGEMVQKGLFREDLYYRLLGLPIELPPLRERGSDIILLSNHFIKEFCNDNDMQEMKISSEAQQKLMNYPFPGNVRELKAIVELGCVMSNNGLLGPEDISFMNSKSISDLLIKEQTLRDYNRRIVKHFLDKYNNNVLKVAEVLDVGKSTIYRMLKNNELIDV